jgi:Tfp pilus assembly protein PilZ
VRTARPESPGTALRLRLTDDLGALEFEGVVAWSNPPGPTAIDPGMGVRFVGVKASDRRRRLALVGRVAYLG